MSQKNKADAHVEHYRAQPPLDLNRPWPLNPATTNLRDQISDPPITIKPQVMYLTANGSFRVLSAKHTAVRCGPHKMMRTIQYTVKIGSRPDLLDHRGFIIDWQDIFQAVAKRFRYVGEFPSCETFAQEILILVFHMLEDRCTSLTVDVGINGLPAHMTAEYKAD